MSVKDATLVDPASVTEEEASLIVTAVQKVAEANDWSTDLWYHDASVWLLYHDDSNHLTLRIVQLTLWMVDGQRELEIVPNVLTKSRERPERYELTLPLSLRQQGIETVRLLRPLIFKARITPEKFPFFEDMQSDLVQKVSQVLRYAATITRDQLVPVA